jgi:hypothetical protein
MVQAISAMIASAARADFSPASPDGRRQENPPSFPCVASTTSAKKEFTDDAAETPQPTSHEKGLQL